jgi:Signal transduction histidine kinase
MHKRLHRKLTLIYSFTTGTIISFVILFVFLFIQYKTEENSKKLLLDTLNNLEYKLQTERSIGQVWLSEMITDKEIFVYMEDNGKPLKIMNYVQAPSFHTNISDIINLVIKGAAKENIITSYPPVFQPKETSRVLFIRGNKKEPYYACVSIIATEEGWQTVLLVKSLSSQQILLFRYGLFLIAIDLAILLFLYFFSKYFVGRTLEPVIENERKQKEFIASASHELKSPLSVIRATISSLELYEENSGSLLEEHFLDNNSETDSSMEEKEMTVSSDNTKALDFKNQRIRYYKDIDEEIQRLAKLVEDLLLLTASQVQMRLLHKESFDMEAFLIDLYEAYSLVAVKNGLKLELELPENNITPIYADKLRLRQALAILLDNAISYSQPHKSIIIHVSQNKHLLVKIIDHGVGIPEDKKPYIFDRFYRGDPSRIDKEHFGLGLSIAKELITLHNGSLSVSDTPDGGSTFTMEIPNL